MSENDDKYRFKCDPRGIVCMLLTYKFVLYTNYAYIFCLLFDRNEINVLTTLNACIYQLMVIFLLWSHYKASFSDPGIVIKPNHHLDFSGEHLLGQSLANGDASLDWSICNRCETYRPPKAHHCRICQHCVRKMDHHCPWINNCVGELNQKYFLQFLFYVAVLAVYTVITIIVEFIRQPNQSQSKAIHSLILLLESLIFGIFVIAVFTDQIQSIFTSETMIEKYKNGQTQANGQRSLPVSVKSKRSAMKEICGTNRTILWILPCSDSLRYRRESSLNV